VHIFWRYELEPVRSTSDFIRDNDCGGCDSGDFHMWQRRQCLPGDTIVDGNLVREFDQRHVSQASPATEEIYIGGDLGDLPAGTHRIAFPLTGSVPPRVASS
jgi:hypothetical protein